MTGSNSTDLDVDVVIVGAGFAGLYMLHRVRDVLGLRAVVIEAADGVGGTWYLNRYPGARCDSESYVYCYSFSEELLQEWEWSGKYPRQPEILAYLEHVADRFDLLRDIRLGTRVEAARYQDADGTWRVRTSAGDTVTARFLVTGMGLLAAAPYTPDIPGLDTFAGECHHTGRWPHEPVDLAGRRVGVIGTGSTGVQAIPVIAEQAAHLHVFQRSPQFTVPARHHTVDRAVLAEIRADYDAIWAKAKWSLSGFPWQHNGRSALDATPEEVRKTFEELWDQGGFRFVFGSYRDLLTDIRANDLAADFVREKIRETVADPDTAARLTPTDHPFGGRRPIIDTDYFETYNRDDVTLVDLRESPIEEVTPRGIRTTAGEIELDVLVLATGFDAVTGPFTRIDITGRDGLALRDAWADGPSTYLGLAVAGFPNMFTITGPGATFGNLPVSIEHHVEWIATCIEDTLRRDLAVVEAGYEAQQRWADHVRAQAERIVAGPSGSWYDGANIPGKARRPLFFFGSFGLYRRTCEDVAANGYEGFDRQPAV
ncbi:flavin-containing monooxygenase [Pseudonocardia sp. RS010]|uniref:flavin-containing monooxygenase n=1 Tax=Pseudonocardia sp. RS010 TaxID=3385979 RepID=UPI0039A35560